MDILTIKAKLRNFLATSFHLHSLEDDENITETGIINSLYYIQLLVFIERDFSIEFDDDEFDIQNLTTLNKISHLIHCKSIAI